MTLWDEIRALRQNYADLENRIRHLEDEKLKERQIVERSNDDIKRRSDDGTGWTLF